MRNVLKRLHHLNTWCHSLLSIVITRTTTKSNLKRDYLYVLKQSIIEESQGRNTRGTGTWKQELKQRSMENTYRPASHGLLNLLSYTSQDHLPRGGTAPSGLCSPSSNINGENIPQASLQVSMNEEIPPLRFFFFSFQITIACVKVAIKLTTTLGSQLVTLFGDI